MSSDDPKVYLAGEDGSPLTSKNPDGPVDINAIRQKYNAQNLFEDVDFPADNSSLGNIQGDISTSAGAAAEQYFWLRPHTNLSFAIVQDEMSSGELCSEYDVRQGGLGDCWYICALQALTKRPDQLKWVIPEDNFSGFDDDKYCGAFHFRFYSMYDDKWVDVVVDDRIPSIKSGPKMIPAFTRISTKDTCLTEAYAEFWGALIEKAFAKFIGSYKKIEGGLTSQGLENFTAGFAEQIDFKDEIKLPIGAPPVTKYEFFKKKFLGINDSGNFGGVGTFSLSESCKDVFDGYSDESKSYWTPDGASLIREYQGYKWNAETRRVEPDPTKTGLGLHQQHAYTVLGAAEVQKQNDGEQVVLISIKNPHAHGEWTGKYSDNDDESWAEMECDLRPRNANFSTNIDEGLFWMDLNDVIKYFKTLEMCYFGLSDGTKLSSTQGYWPKAIQSETVDLSSTPAPETLMKFPAYQFEVKRELLDLQIPAELGNKCLATFTIVIAGYHSEMRVKFEGSAYGLPAPIFGMYVFKKLPESESDEVDLMATFSQKPVVEAGCHARESSKWTFLEPGKYIIVPLLHTAVFPQAGRPLIPDELAGKDIHYAIRVFAENDAGLKPVTV